MTPQTVTKQEVAAQKHNKKLLWIIPIPGTKRRKYLEENIAAVDLVLSEAEVQELGAAFPAGVTAGSRYPAPHMPRVNA